MDTTPPPQNEALLRLVESLSPSKRARLLKELGLAESQAKLSPRQARLVDEYCEHLDERKAKQAASVRGSDAFDDPEVKKAIEDKLKAREMVSDLKADYIRGYILSILELCPTDHFVLTDDGDWAIDPANFRELPHEVKRLVEEVEVKYSRGQRVYKIKFISKTAALAMAARFTLPQKFEVGPTGTPWDELARRALKEVEDPVERRLAEYASRLSEVQGPAATAEAPVAGRVLVLEAEGDRKVGVVVEADSGAGVAPDGEGLRDWPDYANVLPHTTPVPDRDNVG